MSKVIRISDSIFSRLQQHSTPLVDTPASVIERILDYYEKYHQSKVAIAAPYKTSRGRASLSADIKHELGKIGLYLAPADKKNIESTIIKSQPLSIAKSNLSKGQFKVLERELKGKEKFHCWAMTKNSRSYFSAMNKGDLVLLTAKNTGRFSYMAQVICKLESAQLGKALWSVVPNKPWELIYFLENVTHINVQKEKLLAALAYDQGYRIPGIVRVKPERVQPVINRYGSISGLISALKA